MSDINEFDINAQMPEEENINVIPPNKEPEKKEDSKVEEAPKEEVQQKEEAPKEDAPKEEPKNEEKAQEEVLDDEANMSSLNINALLNEDEGEKEKKQEAPKGEIKKEEKKEKSVEEMQQELDEIRAREKARKIEEAERKKKQNELEAAKKKEKKAEEKRRKREANNGKKPSFWDRGILPAVGFAIGAAAGALLGYAVIAVPFIIASLFSGVAKGISFAVKKKNYDKQQSDRKLNMDDKKRMDQKEKEDSKKAEKAVEIAKAYVKEKVKQPEVKFKDAKKENSIGSQRIEVYKQQEAFYEWVDKTRSEETEALNQKHKNLPFEEQKKHFVRHLGRLSTVVQMELLQRKGKHNVAGTNYKEEFNQTVKSSVTQESFKKMTDSIKSPADFDRFRKLANEGKGLGLFDELAKYDKEAEKIKQEIDNPNKNLQKDKQLQANNNQPNVPNM